jgi:hypothetical protein
MEGVVVFEKTTTPFDGQTKRCDAARRVRRKTYFFALLAMLAVSGCGSVKTEPVASPVEISGKVAMSQGSIPEGVKIAFQPTQSGYGESFALQSDGSFKGSMIPGPYMYFFTADESAEGAAALQSVPKPLQEPDLNRKVEVISGQPVSITVP